MDVSEAYRLQERQQNIDESIARQHLELRRREKALKLALDASDGTTTFVGRMRLAADLLRFLEGGECP